MKKHFWIAMDDGTKKEVFGDHIQIEGYNCFITCEKIERSELAMESGDDNEFWYTISEFYSGMIIFEHYSQTHAIHSAYELLKPYYYQRIIDSCRGKLQHAGLNYPLNV